MNGSPTCTVGRFSSVEASNSAEAMVAPWIPSRPVLAPMYITGFPTPAAVPRKILSAGRMPRVKALTRQFPLYEGWNVTSPPTVGTPMQLP